MSVHFRPRPRFSFWAKVGATVTLIVLFDRLFDGSVHPGATVGAFAIAWTATLVALSPAVRRDRRALLTGGAALAFALVQLEDPGLVAWGLFWAALVTAALMPRTGAVGDAWRWSGRLAVHAWTGLVRPLRDLRRLRRRSPEGTRGRLRAFAPSLALPVLGGALFLALFAAANPLIAGALSNLRAPRLGADTIVRVLFWGLVTIAVWPTLRPRLPRPARTKQAISRTPPGVSVTSVTLSLIVFNALFTLQNGLDLAYLWSGAGLPDGMTLAEYAHRGAYPLVITALLAGAFVLVALRPGTKTAEQPLIRRLVALWVLQNVLLVVSTMLRTLNYIDAYSLTRMRIGALVWMALVALGLILICWRLLRGKSAAWLINANAGAVLAVLAMSTVVDVGAVAAAWNVRHAGDAGGHGAELDLCYLNRLGGSALVSLAELERRPISPDVRERVSSIRMRHQAALHASQADWREWTWRGARRLERSRALTTGLNLPVRPGPRNCDGRFSFRMGPRFVPPVGERSPISADPLTPAGQP